MIVTAILFWVKVSIVVSIIAVIKVCVDDYRLKKCHKCGSCDVRTEIKKTLKWGTDMGGIFQEDPFMACSERVVCNTCKNFRETRVWLQEPTDREVDDFLAKEEA
jgi:hypothetical protein